MSAVLSSLPTCEQTQATYNAYLAARTPSSIDTVVLNTLFTDNCELTYRGYLSGKLNTLIGKTQIIDVLAKHLDKEKEVPSRHSTVSEGKVEVKSETLLKDGSIIKSQETIIFVMEDTACKISRIFAEQQRSVSPN